MADVTKPVAALRPIGPLADNRNQFVVWLQFSEPVFNFSPDGLMVTNGSAELLAPTPDGANFAYLIEGDEDGEIAVSLPAGAASDAAGNASLPAGPIVFTLDRTAPVPVLSSTAPDPSNASPIPLRVAFSEPVTGFDLGDVQLTNASAAAAAAGKSLDDTQFDFLLTPRRDGPVGAALPEGAAADALGNPSAAASWSIVYDATPPAVSVGGAPSGVTSTSEVALSVQFSEAVTGFETGGVGVSNAAVTALSGGPASYVVRIAPTATGEVTLTVGAGVAADAAGNPSTEDASLAVLFTGYIAGVGTIHSGDYNGDGYIDLAGLLRIIQLYNFGGFGCDEESEDGYRPLDPDQDCLAHSSDYNSLDWRISLTELLRFIQFYNFRVYYQCVEQEDGFCAGAP